MSDDQPVRDASRNLRQLEHIETLIVSLDEAIEAADIAESARVIARGFVELGAVMVGLFVVEGDHLRPIGRWPEGAADQLFKALHPSGGPLANFRIPLTDVDNPYVATVKSGETRLIHGSENVADHIIRTYGAGDEIRKPLIAALYGKSSAVVPLTAGDRTVGVAGLNYAKDLGETERHLFNIFGRSAGTLLNFKRQAISRESILADLEVSLAQERKTREALNRAERLSALGEMSAVVAHEIRNPLAVIKNSAAAMRRHVSDEQPKMLCSIIDEETASIERIIDDMLAFSTPLELGGARTELRELVDKALYLVGEKSPGRTDVTVIHSEDPLSPVTVDMRQVSHALVNLIVNARDATVDEGTVEVHTGRSPTAERMRIEVIDTGTGIAEANLATVFQPFFTTKADGTGLGLALAKRIIDAHGGRISISSELGKGTTVAVELPCSPSDD